MRYPARGQGVMHNHNVLRNITDEANRMAVWSRDMILIYLPLFHAFGLYGGLLCTGLLAAGLASTEPVARRAQRVLCHTVRALAHEPVKARG